MAREVKNRYLVYSKANKASTSVAFDNQMFKHLEEFYPSISSVSDLNISLCESFFQWLKDTKHNKPATVKRKGTTLKNLGAKAC